MRRISLERLVLALLALLAAGVSPILFPAAQAGLAKLSDLARWLLLPSVGLLVTVIAVTWARGHRALGRRMLAGLAAGAVATLGLEAVRLTGFHLGGMPGDMPKLLGVLLTDRFMLGPSTLSNIAGYAYHFWNGATFGLVFAVVFGRRPLRWAVAYALLIGSGFLASPAVEAMGVGFFAARMPAMIVTVYVAHLVWGPALWLLLRRWLPAEPWLPVSGENGRPIFAGGHTSTIAGRS